MGATTNQEFTELRKILLKSKNKKSILMKCTSIYPSPNSELNLKGILTIRKNGYLAGFSDHSRELHASLCAVALGACVIEKHVKDDKDVNL